MTGTKLYRFSFEVQRRLGSGSGFCCGGVYDPGGPPDLLYGTQETEQFYDNGSVTTTIDYDMTITHDGGVCEDPETSNDFDPEFNYGAYHDGDDEVTFSGDTVTHGAIVDYAKGRAVADLPNGDWDTVFSSSGNTWAAAFALRTPSGLGDGPSVLFSGGLASAGAQEFRFRLRAPFIPVRLIFTQGGADHAFDLTSSYSNWTPGFLAHNVANPITVRAYPLPFEA